MRSAAQHWFECNYHFFYIVRSFILASLVGCTNLSGNVRCLSPKCICMREMCLVLLTPLQWLSLKSGNGGETCVCVCVCVCVWMNSAEYIGLGRILNPKNFCSLLLCKVWWYSSCNHDKPELYLVCAWSLLKGYKVGSAVLNMLPNWWPGNHQVE